ncbi:MAG: helix-turn-helix domain-containing protein [Micrococcales bacterium]|nr:helix-turn-helix domain-containing protein [Micrococcales bacterium]
MTQQELAAAAGMAPSALSARLRGTREFRISELEVIAGVLGVTLRDLLPATEEEPR